MFAYTNYSISPALTLTDNSGLIQLICLQCHIRLEPAAIMKTNGLRWCGALCARRATQQLQSYLQMSFLYFHSFYPKLFHCHQYREFKLVSSNINSYLDFLSNNSNITNILNTPYNRYYFNSCREGLLRSRPFKGIKDKIFCLIPSWLPLFNSKSVINWTIVNQTLKNATYNGSNIYVIWKKNFTV